MTERIFEQTEIKNEKFSREILQALQSGQIGIEDAKRILSGSIEATKKESPKTQPLKYHKEKEATKGFNYETDEYKNAIAIIGISGQFPKADSVEKYWDNIVNKEDCISEVPPSRWDISKYYDKDLKTSGKTDSKWMGVLENVDKFDPLFFSISPAEAELMDPQQRLFLENCWHCIEDAGIGPTELSGSRCGVFVGCGSSNYGYDSNSQGQNAQNLMGGAPSILSARISYLLNLRGPCVAIDTACSSSLVAISEACNNLILQNCDVALAGGVYLMFGPSMFIMSSTAGMLSKDGRCFTFDSRANGFVPGEGVGVVLLKRLSDAIKDNDPVYGVIRGWMVNQDGKTNGITAPSVKSQISLEKEAYKRFGINPETITLIEAHGTGTKLGDPIEVEALTESFTSFTDKKNYCALGSSKSNIGHLVKAAGVAGLIKILLAMKHRMLPPTTNFEKLNEHISLNNGPFYVNTGLKQWDVPDGIPRRACVSSFGFSGTNAHLIVEEYNPKAEFNKPSTINKNNPILFVLSAKNKEQLKRYVEINRDFIEAKEDLNLADMSYTLQVGRDAMDYRLAFIAESKESLIKALTGFISNGSTAGIMTDHVKRGKDGVAVFEADDDAKTLINTWIKKRKLKKLAELWVKGLALDWNKLYSDLKPRRIHLPTYPFLRERYWIPEMGKNLQIEMVQKLSGYNISPVLHQNTSNFFEQRFTSTFTGEEFFLKDHIVKGQRVLPGVVYFEMVRAAVNEAMGVKEGDFTELALKNVIWSRPFIVEEQPNSIHTRLVPTENGEISFDVYSLDTDNEMIIHSQGTAVLSQQQKSSYVDIKELKEECNLKRISDIQCYEIFKSVGIDFGPAHRGIKEVFLSKDRGLARLTLPDPENTDKEGYVVHPSMLDSALQASRIFIMESDTSTVRLALPFAMQELRIFEKCTTDMWVVARFSEGSRVGDKLEKLDIDLYDQNGKLCVGIKAFTCRPVEVEANTASTENTGMLMFSPNWKEEAINKLATPYTKHLVMLCEPDEVSLENIQRELREGNCIALQSSQKDINVRFQTYATRLFEEIQSILLSKPRGKTLLQVVINNKNESRIFSGLSALLKTAQLENPNFVGQIIESESWNDWKRIVKRLEEEARGTNNQIQYSDGKRQVTHWKEVDVLQKEAVSPWKDNGVYLITGGTGGLGHIFAKDIALNTKTPTLILSGRSSNELDKKENIKELQRLGASVQYMQMDVSDSKAVENVIGKIRGEFKQLNGIIHAAGVLRDSFIIKKTKKEFTEVLAPKVSGIVNLDLASKDLSIDFFVCFSSGAGVIGNVGQADYSTANAFMDAFAAYRNDLVALGQRKGHTLSIDWPLWKDGGMKVDAKNEEKLKTKTGMIAMNTSTGITALYRGIASKLSQVIVMEGNLVELRNKMLPMMLNCGAESVADRIYRANKDDKILGEKHQNVQMKVLEIMSGLLHVSVGEFDISTDFSEYALDQYKLADFVNQLNQEYGLELTKTIFFEYSTINELVKYLESETQGKLQKESKAVVEEMNNTSRVSNDKVQKEPKTNEFVIEQDVLNEKADYFFKKLLASVIKLPINKIDSAAELEDYGIDSIVVMQLTNELEKSFGSLSKTLFFEYKSIQELTEYFLESYREQLIDILGLEKKSLEVNEIDNRTTVLNEVRPEPEKNILNNLRNTNLMPIRTNGNRQKAWEDMDIAIIGVSGRYPQSKNIQEYWKNLLEGKDCITEIPKERWDYREYYDEEKGKTGKVYSKWGGFIDDVDCFDALFFNMTPKDAEYADPQERLFLQCVYEAVEDAGYTRQSLASHNKLGLDGSVGVFVGVMNEEYRFFAVQEQLAGNPIVLGGSPASIANRISYYCNFHGPSVALDTMCSSSLSAIHMAYNSIQRGECELAVAGGVNVSIHPNKYFFLSNTRFASSKGLCESFGEGGDGYVPSEGVGAILLKPLERAIADGDHIYGVIKGSSMNHGGKTNGYTVPNPLAQANVIRQTFKKTGINPKTVSYIEAHGTGTNLGDPIEITGLSNVFREYTSDTQFCAIGSSKSNIGHCESAAGVAAVTKVLLQMKHRKLVPSIHSKVLNTKIDFKNSPFVVQQELSEWKRPEIDGHEVPRRAGVSAFGAGGTNVHMLIEEYINENENLKGVVNNQNQAIIALSAKNSERLKELVQRFLNAIDERQLSDTDLVNIAYTLQVGREAMDERICVLVQSIEELKEKLLSYLDGRNDIENLYYGQVRRNKDAISGLIADEDMASTIDAWILKKKYKKLMEYWVKGLIVDWNKLYVDLKPCRVSLPTYPFARERYWVHLDKNSTNSSPVLLPSNGQQFDDLYYSQLIDEVVNDKISIDVAVRRAKNL